MAPRIAPHSPALILYRELSSPKERGHKDKMKEEEEKCVCPRMRPLPFYL
jgi:hypothetical protein